MPEAGPLCTSFLPWEALSGQHYRLSCSFPLGPPASFHGVILHPYLCTSQPRLLLFSWPYPAFQTWRARHSFLTVLEPSHVGVPFPRRPFLHCHSLAKPLLKCHLCWEVSTFFLKQRKSLPPLLYHLYSFGLFSHHIVLFASQPCHHFELLENVTEYSAGYPLILAQYCVQIPIKFYLNE